MPKIIFWNVERLSDRAAEIAETAVAQQERFEVQLASRFWDQQHPRIGPGIDQTAAFLRRAFGESRLGILAAQATAVVTPMKITKLCQENSP